MSCEGNGRLGLRRGRHSLVQFNLLFMRMILPRNISLNLRLVFLAYLLFFYKIGVWGCGVVKYPQGRQGGRPRWSRGRGPPYKLRPIPTLDAGVRGALISSSDYQYPKRESLSDGEIESESGFLSSRTITRRHTPILILILTCPSKIEGVTYRPRQLAGNAA